MGPDEPITHTMRKECQHFQGRVGGKPQGSSGMLITLLMFLELLLMNSQLHNVKTSHPSRALNSIEYAHTQSVPEPQTFHIKN